MPKTFLSLIERTNPNRASIATNEKIMTKPIMKLTPLRLYKSFGYIKIIGNITSPHHILIVFMKFVEVKLA